MKLNKTKRLHQHAKKRACERYGITVNTNDLKDTIKDIHNGKAKIIEKKSCRVTLFEVELNGKTCRVLYDKNRKRIITFVL